MSLFALFFGLMSGCFLSVLVGIVGSKRRIGFGWAFLASLLLTPLVGLLLALISDPLPVGTDRGLGCIGTLFGVLGLLFLVAFLFLLLAGGMLVAMKCVRRRSGRSRSQCPPRPRRESAGSGSVCAPIPRNRCRRAASSIRR